MTPQIKASKATSELEIVSEAFETMRRSAMDALFASPAGKADYREALYRSVQTINTVEQYLRTVIDDGLLEDFAEQVRDQLEAPRA